MASTHIQAGNGAGLLMTAGTTVYTPFSSGRLGQSTPESIMARTIRAAGTLSKLWVRSSANAATATSTVATRVNSSAGAQSVSIAATTTGEFIDSSNSDAVIATDTVDWQTVVGTGGNLTLTVISCAFAATSNTYEPLSSLMNLVSPSGSTTYYHSLHAGVSGLTTTETNAQVKMKHSGTLKNLWVNVSSNGSAGGTLYTCRSRKNAANGNLTIAVADGTTGVFEDTSNSDSFVADDLLNYSWTTGTGTTANIFMNGGAALETTDGTATLGGGAIGASGTTVNASLTRYFPATAPLDANTTEASVSSQINFATTASKLECYISANTVSATSNLKLRKNAGAANQDVSITASTTGWFEDSSNSDTIASTDEIAYELTTGGSGTSLTIFTVAMLITTAGGGRTTHNTRSFPHSLSRGISLGRTHIGN